MKGNLIEDGFEIFNIRLDKEYISLIKNIEITGMFSNEEDVFRDELGRIKQIQNLDHKFIIHRLKKMYKNIEIINCQMFIKHPNYKITIPHQDNAYFNSNEEIYTAWIPLQDVDTSNSCMYYLKGSHKNGLLEHIESGNITRTRSGVTGKSLEYLIDLDLFEPIPLNVGEFVIHDKNTLHYSSQNKSNDIRIALTVIFKIKKELN